MENIILCSECQGAGRLLRTKKKRKKKLSEKGISISASEPLKQHKEDEEYVICFRCGGLGTISI